MSTTSNGKFQKFQAIANSGKIYDSMDDSFLDYQHHLVQKINEFNQTPETASGLREREAILRDVLGTYQDGLYIIPPIYANSGLSNVHVGKNVVINFDCRFIDDGEIFIGADTMIGPGCTFATANHPISPRLRRRRLQYNYPIHIGENVWFGAGVIVLPGVTIGNNTIIGAGSIVTRDIPENTIAVGNPAKVLRQITADDDKFYDGRPIPDEFF